MAWGRTHGQLSGKSHKEKWMGKWWLIDINRLSLNWPSNFRCTAFSNKAITREGSWLHCRWGPNTTPIMAKTLSMACVTSSGHGNLLACPAMTHREAQELPQITLPSSQSHQIHQSLFPLPATPCLFACITISDVGIRTGLELLELLLLLGPAKAREPVQIKLCEDRTSGGESQIRTLVKPHKWEKNERWDTWIYGHVDGERMINPWVWSSWAKSEDNSPDVWTPVSHPKPRVSTLTGTQAANHCVPMPRYGLSGPVMGHHVAPQRNTSLARHGSCWCEVWSLLSQQMWLPWLPPQSSGQSSERYRTRFRPQIGIKGCSSSMLAEHLVFK